MTIKMFTSYKRTLNEKKYLRPFNKKSTFICWNSLKIQKILITAKQLFRKSSVCC